MEQTCLPMLAELTLSFDRAVAKYAKYIRWAITPEQDAELLMAQSELNNDGNEKLMVVQWYASLELVPVTLQHTKINNGLGHPPKIKKPSNATSKSIQMPDRTARQVSAAGSVDYKICYGFIDKKRTVT